MNHVNFTAWWPSLGPRNGRWAVPCSLSSPTHDDVYECDWNFSGAPAGNISISFDVYDNAGNANYAPNGIRTIIYSPQQVRPTATPVRSSMPPSAHDPGGIQLCEHANYGGTCRTFGVGEYRDLTQYGLDGKASSLRDPNGAYHVTLYDQPGLTGTPGYFDNDTPQLPGYWNDRARSIRVERH